MLELWGLGTYSPELPQAWTANWRQRFWPAVGKRPCPVADTASAGQLNGCKGTLGQGHMRASAVEGPCCQTHNNRATLDDVQLDSAGYEPPVDSLNARAIASTLAPALSASAQEGTCGSVAELPSMSVGAQPLGGNCVPATHSGDVGSRANEPTSIGGLCGPSIKEAADDAAEMLLEFQGLVEDTPCSILIDGGATNCFVSSDLLDCHGIKYAPMVAAMQTAMANGQQQACVGVIPGALVEIDGYKGFVKLLVTKLGNHRVILGKPWLARHNPTIDWRANRVSF
jgi:hypothetical protein